MPTHLTKCEFRTVPCPHRNCVDRIRLDLLLDHMGENHATSTGSFAFDVSQKFHYSGRNLRDRWSERWWVGQWTCNEHVFIVMLLKKKGTWYLWAHAFGSKSDARDYRYEVDETSLFGQVISYLFSRLKVCLSAEDKVSVTAKLGVHTIDTTEGKILSGDHTNVLVIDHSMAQKMLIQNGGDVEKIYGSITFLKN